MEVLQPELFSIPATNDGLMLAAAVIRPAGQAVGILQMIHGMAEHKERYYGMMEYFASLGYITVIHDNRGHGGSVKSPEDLGFMYSAMDRGLISDIHDVKLWATDRYRNLPIFLYGHSMGSMAARAYCREHDDEIDGVIVSGTPAYNPYAPAGMKLCKTLASIGGGRSDIPGKGWRKVSRIMARAVFGSIASSHLSEGSHNSWLCSDPAVIAAYNSDPLCGFKFTLNGYYSVLSLMHTCNETSGWNMYQPDLPFHFISGEDDACMGGKEGLQANINVLKKAGYHNITSRIYPGIRHAVQFDVSKKQVWKDMARMMDSWAEI